MTPPLAWQEVLWRLRQQGLTVLTNLASGSLAVVPFGTTFAQVPSQQWRPGLTPQQVSDLADDPGRLALYLRRSWRTGWLDAQRRPAPPRPGRQPSDFDDPWSDAPEDR